MMPSLYGVVNNIKKLRSHRMALAAGCTLTMAAMIVVPSVVEAYGEQIVDDGSCGQYNLCDQSNGFGGDYLPYSDGSYGGYLVDEYQNQNASETLVSSPDYGLDTPYYYNGMWNSQPTPSPAPADLQNNDGIPPDGDVPVDDGVPVDNGGDTTPLFTDQPSGDQNPSIEETSPAPSPSPQAVATANATAKVIIEKAAQQKVSRTQASMAMMPAELPTTGLAEGAVVSGIGLSGMVAAMAYYLNSRRELRYTLTKR